MADQVLFAEYQDRYIFKFVGNFTFSLCPAVEGFMRRLLGEKEMRPVVIDMNEATGVDSTGMGILAQIAVHCKRMLQIQPILLASDNDILNILKAMDFECVFTIVRGAATAGADFKEIKPVAADEQEITRHILEAHRALMNMTPDNRAKFEQVIKILEKQVPAGG
jgi:anti-anti-sigma regulatory factor